ncbi:hypothetical protein [Caballeronia sp. LZ034LL]|uniref:A1S_2505 family phage non-structural protein n=1 Tax=Caballeronia sp. LZ034LL TaxID=3038567 RepID=UPI002862047A|nr:hypothetical protein [Caballeronia sp. LZ034LL]MDR5839347.1 hypothetical protein [Caballeronia sp. LZ034LL]
MIFVFGSNEGGIHGAGAAKVAMMKHGAKWGEFFGPTGNAFAIPTKGVKVIHHRAQAADGQYQGPIVGDTLSLERIAMYVAGFIDYAHRHPELEFQVTRIGCGLAGLHDVDVAYLFTLAPNNCFFDEKWKDILGDDARYWGTF